MPAVTEASFASQLEATKTPEEVAALRTQLKARLQELDTDFQGREFDQNAREEFAAIREASKRAEARELEFRVRRDAVMEQAIGTGGLEAIGADLRPRSQRQVSRIPDNIHDIQEYRARTSSEEGMTALMVDGAKKAAELARYPHERATADGTTGHIHKLLDTVDDPQGLARHILATGSPEYSRAFAKHLAGMRLSQAEQAAIAVVGTTTTGGYNVPFTLDPTLILTSDASVNPLRQISRVEQIVGNTWKGISTAGITITRGQAEGSAVTPSEVTFGQPEATVNIVRAEIQFSIESDEDWPQLQSSMARVLQDAKDAEEADAFVNDTGAATHAEGIVFGLAASSDVGTTGDGFDLEDVQRLIGRLPDKYEPRARFLGHRTVYGEIERLDRAAGGAVLYRSLSDSERPSLLGYPRHNSSAMESDFTTEGNDVLLFGDFQYFLIVDRIGLSIEVDQHVRDTNGKWTGQRALLAHYRNTSRILVDNAFRLLKIGVVTS